MAVVSKSILKLAFSFSKRLFCYLFLPVFAYYLLLLFLKSQEQYLMFDTKLVETYIPLSIAGIATLILFLCDKRYLLKIKLLFPTRFDLVSTITPLTLSLNFFFLFGAMYLVKSEVKRTFPVAYFSYLTAKSQLPGKVAALYADSIDMQKVGFRRFVRVQYGKSGRYIKNHYGVLTVAFACHLKNKYEFWLFFPYVKKFEYLNSSTNYSITEQKAKAFYDASLQDFEAKCRNVLPNSDRPYSLEFMPNDVGKINYNNEDFDLFEHIRMDDYDTSKITVWSVMPLSKRRKNEIEETSFSPFLIFAFFIILLEFYRVSSLESKTSTIAIQKKVQRDFVRTKKLNHRH